MSKNAWKTCRKCGVASCETSQLLQPYSKKTRNAQNPLEIDAFQGILLGEFPEIRDLSSSL
jgi:hypothetical protein